MDAHPTDPGARDDAFLRVSPTCRVRMSELEWRFTGSGGPGGQHANTANTRVELRFDIESSPSLGPVQRARLLERLGPNVRIVASDARSQSRNRELALERLASRLRDGLRVDRARRATRPTRSAKAARVEAKRQRSETKARRRKPTWDD